MRRTQWWIIAANSITEEVVSWLQSHGTRLKKGWVSERNLFNNTFYCNFTYTNLTAPLIFVRILYCREEWLRWPRSRCHCPRSRRIKVLLLYFQEIDFNERWTERWHEFFVGTIITDNLMHAWFRLFPWALLSLSGFTTRVMCSNFGAER